MATTEDRIIEIAEKLEAEGVNPTQVTVREALGGGSFATIGPILKRWKESKKEDSKLAEVQVPEALIDRLEQLKGAVWQAAVDEADRRLMAEREALHQAQEQAAAEVRELLESVKTLESEAEDYQRKIESLEETGRALDVELRNAQADLAAVKEKALTDNKSLSEVIVKETGRREAAEARAERAESLHREALEQSRADLAALKKEHKAELAIVKQEAADQVKQAAEGAREQEKRAEKAEKDAQQRATEEQACQSRLEVTLRELDQMKQRMVKLEERADTATQEAAELRGEVKALKEKAPKSKG